MLKFLKHHMESIVGIEIYPIISFTIFFLFFLALIIYMIKADKKEMEIMKNLPLDNDQQPLNP